jgi:hypothetical protein
MEMVFHPPIPFILSGISLLYHVITSSTVSVTSTTSGIPFFGLFDSLPSQSAYLIDGCLQRYVLVDSSIEIVGHVLSRMPVYSVNQVLLVLQAARQQACWNELLSSALRPAPSPPPHDPATSYTIEIHPSPPHTIELVLFVNGETVVITLHVRLDGRIEAQIVPSSAFSLAPSAFGRIVEMSLSIPISVRYLLSKLAV